MENRPTVREKGREGRLVEVVEEREGGKWAIGLLWKREGEKGGWWRLWGRGRMGGGHGNRPTAERKEVS